MSYFYRVVLILFLMELLSCQSSAPLKETEPQLLEVKSIPLPKELPDVQLVKQPDPTGKAREDFKFSNSKEQEENLDIVVEVLEKWDNSNTYFVQVNFVNTTDKDITKTIYVLHYDAIGRLVSSQSISTYFRANNHFVSQFAFPKNGSQVRWIIKVR